MVRWCGAPPRSVHQIRLHMGKALDTRGVYRQMHLLWGHKVIDISKMQSRAGPGMFHYIAQKIKPRRKK